MKLSKKDLNLISKAEQALTKSRIARGFLLAIMAVAFGLMVAELIDTNTFSYLMVGIVVYAIFLPNISGPKYEELVRFLVKVRERSDVVEEDPIISALASK
jgi:hypothetical protein